LLSLDDARHLKLISLGYMGSNNDAEKKFWEDFLGGEESPNGTSFYSGRTGQSTFPSDGLQTVFTVAHGLPGVPVYASMIGRNTNSGGEKFVNWDATNVSVTYLVAPVNGTVTFNWIALI